MQNDDNLSNAFLELKTQFNEIEEFVSDDMKKLFYSAIKERNYIKAKIVLEKQKERYLELARKYDLDINSASITKNLMKSYIKSSDIDLDEQKRLSKLNNLKAENNNLKNKVNILSAQNKELEEKNKEFINKTKAAAIEEKVPGYVKKATSSLSEDVIGFTCSAVIWAGAGMVFIIMAITAVLFTYLNTPDYKSLSNLQIVYLFTRGLIGVGILCWAAQYCLSMTKSFTHEIVRRKDTIHSIRFGELFLEIFGSSVTKNEAMEAFKNWNNAGNTAFNEPVENAPVVKLKEYGNDLSEVAKNRADLAAKLTPEKK